MGGRIHIDKMMGGRVRDKDVAGSGIGDGMTWEDFITNYGDDLRNWLINNFPDITTGDNWNDFITNYGDDLRAWLTENYPIINGDTWEEFITNFGDDLSTWLETNYPTVIEGDTWEDFITNLGDDLRTWLETNYPAITELTTWEEFITNFENDLRQWIIDNSVDILQPINWEDFITTFGDDLRQWLTENYPVIENLTWEEFLNKFGDDLRQWITENYPQLNDTLTWNEFIDLFGDDLRQWLTENYPNIIDPLTWNEFIDQFGDDLRQWITDNFPVTEGDTYIEEIINQYLENYNGTRLISGSVTWIENLDFDLSHLVYEILGIRAESPATVVTIPANTAADPVYAVIYADLGGNTGYILGTPAPAPAVPMVNQNNQIALTTIFIPANGTEPGEDPDGNEITNDIIYDENIEWDTVKTEVPGFAINLEALTSPQQGVKHIQIITAGTPGQDNVEFISPTLKTKIDISPAIIIDLPVDYIGDLHEVQPTLNISTNQIFPDNQSDVMIGTIRTLTKYSYEWPRKPVAYFRNTATGEVYTMVYALFDNSNVTILGTSLVNTTFHFYANPTTIPAGNYAVTFTNFVKYQYRFETTATEPTTATGDAKLTFTRPAGPVEAKDGNIIFSLETSKIWLQNSGLLFELYNGDQLAGSFNFAAAANGLTEQTGDYTRFTIPVSSFNPVTTVIDKLVIHTLGNFLDLLTINIDNIVLQTGLVLPEPPDEPLKIGDWIEDMTFDYRDAAAAMIYPIDPLVSFPFKIIEAVLNADAGTITAALTINDLPVAGINPALVTTATQIYKATAANMAKVNDVIKLTITDITDATAITGKLRIVRV